MSEPLHFSRGKLSFQLHPFNKGIEDRIGNMCYTYLDHNRRNNTLISILSLPGMVSIVPDQTRRWYLLVYNYGASNRSLHISTINLLILLHKLDVI